MSQKTEGSATTTTASTGDATGEREKPSRSLEPYRRMLPGMNLKKEGESENSATRRDSKNGVGEEGEREEEGEGEGEEERPSLPTPRKRLMNFKIPLVRGAGQRRDQRMSVVARRNLFRGGIYTVHVYIHVCCTVCLHEGARVMMGEFTELAKKIAFCWKCSMYNNIVVTTLYVIVIESDDQSKPPPKPEPSLRNDHGFYSDISSSEDFSSASEGEEEEEGREGEGEGEGESSAEEAWDSEAESAAEKSSLRYV